MAALKSILTLLSRDGNRRWGCKTRKHNHKAQASVSALSDTLACASREYGSSEEMRPNLEGHNLAPDYRIATPLPFALDGISVTHASDKNHRGTGQ